MLHKSESRTQHEDEHEDEEERPNAGQAGSFDEETHTDSESQGSLDDKELEELIREEIYFKGGGSIEEG